MCNQSLPNILIIFCDDLGYGDIGCYGSKLNRTPKLDWMAKEGVRFTDFYVPAAVCSPSRAGLMTGCYPKRVGLESGHLQTVLFPGDPIGLHADEVIIPEILKAAGYKTQLIGKWHLGDQPDFLPTQHGFDQYFGLPYSNDMIPDHPANPYHHFPPLPLMRDDAVEEADPNQATLTDRYTAAALRFMDESVEAGKPFFICLAHMYVHLPIYAPYRHLAESQNGAYGAAVEHIDASAGVLLQKLSRLGIDNNTLVIFTSDNGSNGKNGGSNGCLRGAKGTTWEGGMRVPCIARWPGRIPAGNVCRELATTMDFLPTLTAITNTALPAERTLDGHDIRPLLFNENGAASPYSTFFYYSANDRSLHAVRAGKWKLHLVRDELYDLSEDPGEMTDLIGEHPRVAEELRAFAAECRKELGDTETGITGRGCRPVGKVSDPRPIISRDSLDPYQRALYD